MALSALAMQALGGLLNMGIQLGGQYLSNKMNQSTQGGSLSGSTGGTSSAMNQTGMTSQSMGQSMASQSTTTQPETQQGRRFKHLREAQRPQTTSRCRHGTTQTC